MYAKTIAVFNVMRSGTSSLSSPSAIKYIVAISFGYLNQSFDTDCSWAAARIQHDARKRPQGMACAAAWSQLDFRLLKNLWASSTSMPKY